MASRATSAAMFGAALVMGLTACGNSASASGASGSSDSSSAHGGTLYVLMAAGQLGTSLDPATSYSQSSENVSPLIISPLTMYVPGSNPAKVVGDLATNAGTPSDGGRVWTFHLRKMTYSNGQPITSYDVKYGVERSFASDLQGGPPYLRGWIQGGTSYKGPYVDKNGLPSIGTPNASTIVFKLNQPIGDFDYLTTYPEFSGVPQKLDTGVKYGNNPVTSGPYKIASNQLNKQLVLVRNPRWNRSWNPYIKAYPDKIVFEQGLDPSVIDQRLIADQGNDQYAVGLDQSVQASDLANVLNNPQVKARADIKVSGAAFWYLAMNMKAAPFDKLKVRQAMEYAVNKSTFQTAAGGPIGGGPITNQILGPGIRGYQKFDEYPAGPTGNPAKAKQLLAQAGYPHGFSTTLETPSDQQSTNEATALQSALARVGVTLKLKTLDPSVYYSAISSPKSAPPLAISAWGADWADASTIIPPLFDGRQMTASGPNNDITGFDSSAANGLIDKADALPPSQAAPLWAQLDRMIMAQAPVVPLINFSTIHLHGSKVHNTTIDSFGTYNPLVLSVR